jgi:hypothetical protein
LRAGGAVLDLVVDDDGGDGLDHSDWVSAEVTCS